MKRQRVEKLVEGANPNLYEIVKKAGWRTLATLEA
jgi:hypothetical protein